MTHITSKEVAEGNLKSIMRVILALAAHYKPQSVKAALLHQQETTPAASACTTTKHPVTHGRSLTGLLFSSITRSYGVYRNTNVDMSM